MKTKSKTFKFYKKEKKLEIPSSTIEKIPNNYSKILCNLLNTEINNNINNKIKEKIILNNNENKKITENKDSNEDLFKHEKLSKLKGSFNYQNKELNIKSYKNRKQNGNIRKQKSYILQGILEKSSPSINKIDKNNLFYSLKKINQIDKYNNCFSSKAKRIKLKINLSNKINLLTKQKSFNNKKIKKENKSKLNLNENKIKCIKIIKAKSICIQNGIYSNQNEKLKKIKKKNNRNKQ